MSLRSSQASLTSTRRSTRQLRNPSGPSTPYPPILTLSPCLPTPTRAMCRREKNSPRRTWPIPQQGQSLRNLRSSSCSDGSSLRSQPGGFDGVLRLRIGPCDLLMQTGGEGVQVAVPDFERGPDIKMHRGKGKKVGLVVEGERHEGDGPAEAGLQVQEALEVGLVDGEGLLVVASALDVDHENLLPGQEAEHGVFAPFRLGPGLLEGVLAGLPVLGLL